MIKRVTVNQLVNAYLNGFGKVAMVVLIKGSQWLIFSVQ